MVLIIVMLQQEDEDTAITTKLERAGVTIEELLAVWERNQQSKAVDRKRPSKPDPINRRFSLVTTRQNKKATRAGAQYGR
jgi:uncharacterized protein with PIN domain